MEYATLKAVHVGAVWLSIGGFVLRGILMLSASPLLRARMTRIAPHAVDTVLLASALALAWQLGQLPLPAPWLTAKILGLLAYIVLGMVALRRGRTLRARGVAFVLAVLMFAYILIVAFTKDPLPGF